MLGVEPKISVLITFYNQKNYTNRVVESVLSQSYKNLEVILSDDGSDDGIEQEVTPFLSDPRIRFRKNDHNLGRVAHFKWLVHHEASGELVTLVNADDFFIDPDFFSKAVELFNQEESVDLVFGRVGVFLEKNKTTKFDKARLNRTGVYDGNDVFFMLPDGLAIPHISSIYKRKRAVDLDFYRLNQMSQDWESLYRMVINSKVGYVADAVALYGKHFRNVSKLPGVARMLESTGYIEHPYELAKQHSIAPKAELDLWKERMLVRYFTKCHIKLSMLQQEELSTFYHQLEIQYPDIHQKLKVDYKLKTFEILKHTPKILVWCFRIFVGHSSLIEDLIQTKKVNGSLVRE